MEAYAGRAAMEARARKQDNGTKTILFKLMEERGRTRLTSAIWGRAAPGDKLATQLIDDAVEALGAGVASAVNLLDVEAVIIGGGLGVRFGEPFVERIATAMHRICSTMRAAGDAPRGARRPWRRARRRAAGAAAPYPVTRLNTGLWRAPRLWQDCCRAPNTRRRGERVSN